MEITVLCKHGTSSAVHLLSREVFILAAVDGYLKLVRRVCNILLLWTVPVLRLKAYLLKPVSWVGCTTYVLFMECVDL